MSSAALVKYMGCVKILVACAMAASPQTVYNSPLAQKVAKRTHLTVTDAKKAPDLNQAVACMVAAIGMAHIAAAQSPAGRSSVFVLDGTWAMLTLLSALATPRAWKLGSPTLVITACTHILFCAVLWFVEPGVVRGLW